MKLTDREQRAYELGWLEAQGNSAAALAKSLRSSAAASRAERGAGSLAARMRAALFWEVTELWCRRLDGMALHLQSQGAAIEPQAKAKRAELEQTRFLEGLRSFGKRKG